MQQALYSCFRGPDMKLRTLRHVRVRIRKARRAPPRVPGWWVGSSCGVAQEARDASSSSKATTASTSKASQPSPETSDASGQSDRARKRRQRKAGRTARAENQKDRRDSRSPQQPQQWNHFCPERQRISDVWIIFEALFRRTGALKIYQFHTEHMAFRDRKRGATVLRRVACGLLSRGPTVRPLVFAPFPRCLAAMLWWSWWCDVYVEDAAIGEDGTDVTLRPSVKARARRLLEPAGCGFRKRRCGSGLRRHTDCSSAHSADHHGWWFKICSCSNLRA